MSNHTALLIIDAQVNMFDDESKDIGHLVLTGMQTELCIATTCRRAVALGYEVTLVEDGHSTFDYEAMKAGEAIARHNAELGKIPTVKKAAEIKFG